MQPMKTRDLLEAGLRLVGLLSVLAVVLTLISCGPGSGGTGTGPSTVLGSANFSSVAGAISSPSASNTQLRVEPSLVDVSAPCLRFVHEGSWMVDTSNVSVMSGELEVSARGVTRLTAGSLRLVFDGPTGGHQVLTLFDPSTSQQVTVTVYDEAGREVLGPVTLRRQEGAFAPVAGSCS